MRVEPASLERPDVAVDPELVKFCGQGSASSLLGNQNVIFIFVDSLTTLWSCSTRRRVEGDCQAAVEWLYDQSQRYGGAVKLNYRVLPEESLAVRVSATVDAKKGCPQDHKLWHDEAASVLVGKQGSLTSLWDTLFSGCLPRQGSSAAVVFLVHLPGSSWAFPFDPSQHEEWQMERANIYSGGGDYDYTYLASQIAHEVLHLFGAIDLRDSAIPSNISPATADAIRQNRLQISIMLQPNNQDLQNYQVDDLTAYLVGWSNRPPAWLP